MRPTTEPTDEQIDLALAAELQAALLPRGCPKGCSQHALAARNRMCGQVGGDFYDFIRVNEDQTVIVIGDVVGHGVSAALMMAQIMGFLRSESRSRARPLTLMAALNEMLLELGGRIHSVVPCSMVYMVLDHPTGLALLINAGHPRPLLCSRNTGRVAGFGTHDLILGVEPTAHTELCHTLSTGERMVLHTDGLTDAMDGRGERFGGIRLRKTIARHLALDAEQFAEAVVGEVEAFRSPGKPTDDESLVVVDRL
jgi:sigma-B regulation protein RsbU (phosphoserine phosphatase)